MSTSFITLEDGRRLAYNLTEGAGPCVVFLSGFRSDMNGTKAVALEEFCRARGQRFLRFDYTGHGQSSGDFMDGTIGSWKRDAVDMLDRVVGGDCILVGSSMGGWLMLLAALERPAMVKGLVGIASAPDFTKAMIESELNESQQNEMAEKDVVYVPDCYGDTPFPITRALIEDGHEHLLLHKPIPLHVPVRLIHGTKDADVPWQVSQKLLESLVSTDVKLTLVKDAGHRLSEPSQLDILYGFVEELLPPL